MRISGRLCLLTIDVRWYVQRLRHQSMLAAGRELGGMKLPMLLVGFELMS